MVEFKFKSVSSVTSYKTRETTGRKSRHNKLLTARVVFLDGEYKAQINADANILSSIGKVDAGSSIMLLDFTKKSYDNKGKTTVFSVHEPDKRYTVYLRDDAHARHFPGTDKQYQTLAKDWICDGYVCRVNGSLKFDLHQMIKSDKTYEYSSN